MLALWIGLGILAFFWLLGRVPLGVTAVYNGDGPRVDAAAGPFHIRLYPRPPKAPGKQEKQKEPDEPEKEQTPEQREKRSLGGQLPMFKELLGLVLEAQGALRNRLRIRELTLHLTVGGKGDDPAQAAVRYGSAWAAIGNLLPLLERAFRIEKRDIDAQVDFTQEETTVYAKAAAVISLGALLRMGVYYGLRALKLYR